MHIMGFLAVINIIEKCTCIKTVLDNGRYKYPLGFACRYVVLRAI